jgi:hypothetical protein
MPKHEAWPLLPDEIEYIQNSESRCPECGHLALFHGSEAEEYQERIYWCEVCDCTSPIFLPNEEPKDTDG